MHSGGEPGFKATVARLLSRQWARHRCRCGCSSRDRGRSNNRRTGIQQHCDHHPDRFGAGNRTHCHTDHADDRSGRE